MQRFSNPNAMLVSQVENWRSRLLDVGNRNPLISTSFNPTRGVIELVHPSSESVWKSLITSGEAGCNSLRFPWKRDLIQPSAIHVSEEHVAEEALHHPEVENESESINEKKDWNPSIADCLNSPELQANDLVTTLGDRALDRRIRTLDGYANLSLSEQGIHSLYLVFGFLKWFESTDSEKEIRSPLILVPTSFSRETSDSPWELQKTEDELTENVCLRHRFKQDFGFELPPFPEIEQLEEENARLEYLSRVRDVVGRMSRWEVEDRCCIGRFAFPKIAMWQDLGDHKELIAQSAICQSLGGQQFTDLQVVFGDSASVPSAQELDDCVAPGDIKAILDCDSSQLEAIVAARSGISFVLDGPPGTGKSQTIANIIADALSVGKKVLFVSEKVAALEVVKRRLDNCGIGDFCLECHSSKANRKTVLEELKRCLNFPPEKYNDPKPKLEELEKKRQNLNDYVRMLHQPQQPIGMSLYELHGNIARLTRSGMIGKSSTTFSNPDRVDSNTYNSWLHLLKRAPEHRTVLSNFAHHPWRGYISTHKTLTLKSDVRNGLEQLAKNGLQIANDLMPLEEHKLIPVGTKERDLPILLARLKSHLEVPDIPASWLASPRKIAKKLLNRHQIHEECKKLCESLDIYNDDVASLYSEEVLPLTDLSGYKWLDQLKTPLPHTFPEALETLKGYDDKLTEMLESIRLFEESLKELIAEIHVPINENIAFGTFSKFLSVVRLIAREAPFRASWFNSQLAKKIDSDAKKVIQHLELIKKIEGSVSARIKPDSLLELARDFDDLEEIRHSWTYLQSNSSSPNIKNLDDYLYKLQDEEKRLRNIESEFKQLASWMKWNVDFVPSIKQIRNLVDALPNLLGASGYNGYWVEPEVRAEVKQQVEATLLDLAEAQELQNDLVAKFSHRAFLPAAQKIVNRGSQFESWWNRMVGGYSKFRMDIADLYKSPVPSTKSLMADLQLLRAYHRRMGEVINTHQILKVKLLPNLQFDQHTSWKETLTSLYVFSEFISDCPDAASMLSKNGVSIGKWPDASTSPVQKLASLLQSPTSGVPCNEAESIEDALWRINEAIESLSQFQQNSKRCELAIQRANSKYEISIEIPQLIEDIELAKTYADIRQVVETMYNERIKDLPEGAQAFNRDGWRAAVEGIDSVSMITKSIGVSALLINTLSSPGRISSDRLIEKCKSAENSFRAMCKPLFEQTIFTTLTPVGQKEVDIRKRTAKEFRNSVAAAKSDFEVVASSLSKLQVLVKPGVMIPFERLVEDVKSIAILREKMCELEDLNSWLDQSAVVHPLELSEDDCMLIDWIQSAPNELLSSPLTKSISTSSDIRALVSQAVQDMSTHIQAWKESWAFFSTLFDVESDVSTGFVPSALSISELPTIADKLKAELDSLDEWISFKRWRSELKRYGLYQCLEELLSNKYSPEEAEDAVCARFYQKLFDLLVSSIPAIGDFDGVRHEQIRDEYRALDEWEIKGAATRVREYQLNRQDRPRVGWAAPMSSELGILKKETEKKRRHMPLRKLFNAVPDVLQRLKPCIMMSPLSVSTYLESEALKFDLVIFDEASQVFPWDAIGAIYRGNQLIVAGDDKQLPPTSFFSRGDIESEDEDDDIGDFESILKLCNSINMPSKRLRWHYRSRRESLIAFSNSHFYDGDLVTFPSVLDASGDAVQLIYVEDGVWSDRKNIAEAKRVAELVIEHFRCNPEKSLGVIAFNQTQQQAIEDSIYYLRRKSPEVDILLKATPHEPLFVKNLENVQGDERDVILLSVGYGRNPAGSINRNFGPLSKTGGERRLNVAITRAREAVKLVASFRACDLDLDGITGIGTHLLKAYLDYAEHGVDSMRQSISLTQNQCDSPFEEEVAAALIQHGLDPVAQVGCGGFRIDFALKHPNKPGTFCLGIECDGATYHSSKTARDRDRIRQEILEGLGWRICRIWSTDWVRNPDKQIKRVLDTYHQIIESHENFDLKQRNAPELESEDLQPTFPSEEIKERNNYQTIEDVPQDIVSATVLQIVTRSGAVEWDELVSSTSRELGFARSSKKIRERIEETIHEQVRSSNLHRSENKLFMR